MIEPNTIHKNILKAGELWSQRIALQMFSLGKFYSYTYAQLLKNIKTGAEQIKKVGIKPGDRVVLISGNSPEWVIAYIAALEAETTVVLIDPALALQDLTKLIEKSDPRLLILSSHVWEKLPSEARLGLPVLNLENNLMPFKGTPFQVPSELISTIDPDPEVASILFTSGTGGFPKGVLVTHQSLLYCALCGLNLINIKSTNQQQNFLCILPLHHIAALTGLLIAPLLNGAIITFVEPVDRENIFAVLTKTEITILPAVPRFYDLIYGSIIKQIEQKGKLTQTIIKNLGSFSYWVRSFTSWNLGRQIFPSVHKAFGGQLKICFCGASPLATEVKLGMEKLGFTILEGYGLTEAGVCVYNSLNQPRIGHVGKPYKDIEIRIDQPDPTTGEGEICLRGISLMKGYFRDAEATAQVLREGWLYTGDLGRLDAQGNLIVTGRIKEIIVTAGGKKITPTMIEEYYRGLIGVKELAVFGMPAREGLGESVHAAVVLDTVSTAQEVNEQEILQKIWQEIEARSLQVPIYLRIQKIHLVEELPKTTTLKIKRKELQKLVARTLLSNEREKNKSYQSGFSTDKIILDRETLFALPHEQQRLKLEAYLLEAVSTVLQLDLTPSDINESLLALGIDSLNAIELINRLRSDLGWEVSIQEVLKGINIQQLAACWENTNTPLITNELTITPISRQDNLPLSYDQERLWFLAQLFCDHSIYNLSITVQLTGRLEINILQQTLEAIAQRHEILRTNFNRVNGTPVMVIAPSPTISLSIINLHHLPETEHLAEVKGLATLEAQKPFDLMKDVLWRVTLVQLTEDSHVFLLTMHHIISDVWSISLFLQELSTLYETFKKGETNSLPDLVIQYADFAYWTRQQRSENHSNPELDYWKKQLKNLSVEFPLPTDHSRPSKPSLSNCYYNFQVSAQVWSALKRFSKQHSVTPFITLLTAFNILLNQSSGQTDIVIGSPLLGRNHQQLQSLIGFFAYPIVLRNDLSDNPTFEELLQRVRQVVLEAYAHQNISLEQIVKVVQSQKRQLRNSLFQILFSFLGQQPSQFNNSDFTLSPVWELFKAPTDLDLLLTLLEVDEQLIGLLTYNADLFEEETITTLMNSYCLVLEQCVNSSTTPLDQFYLQAEFPSKNIINVNTLQPISTQTKNLEKLSPKLVITANFTADLLIDTLEFWFKKIDLDWNIELAPYNQVFQQLLEPDSLITRNQAGVNVILLRLEEWIKNYNTNQLEGQEKTVREFIDALKAHIDRTTATYILCFCPTSPDNMADNRCGEWVQQMEELIKTDLAEVRGIYLLNYPEILTQYSVLEFYDSYGDKQADIPYTPLFFTALGTAIARKIYAFLKNSYKVIVLDCDQTLWQGVCGEDSLDKILIPNPYQALQKFMLDQQKQGMLLCLCSKNNEADVFQVFEQHQDMLLKKEDLVSWRINWQSKSENLKFLSQELDLGLNSFIFIDDNPVECAEIKANCPEVLTIELPQIPESIPQFLQHIWSFDSLKVTEEDKKRTLYYQQNVKRQQLFQNSLTLEEFIKNLNLKVQITEMSPPQVLRVSQLTQRTNQFNNSTIRRSESEIQNLCQLEGYSCLVVEVQDRFGDYGLVGVILFVEKANNLEVDSFLLSCRVLGKGVEHQMLAYLGKTAQQRGLIKVIIPYKPTPKNEPILNFLTSVGETYKKPCTDGYCFEIPASVGEAITYKPESKGFQKLPIQPQATRSGIREKPELINHIATNMYKAEMIYQAIEAEKQKPIETTSQGTTSKGELIAQITDIMAEILGLPEILPTTNFFEIGGTSFDAVRLLSNLHHQLNLNISLDDFFLNPTAKSLTTLVNGTLTPKNKEDNLGLLLAQDLELDLKQVPFQSKLWHPKSKIKHILLTGSTGNLGVFLLMDLLRLTDATVYCLVRANNEEEGLKRLQEAFEKRELLWSNEVNRRIRIVVGDLSKPQLGWDDHNWIEYGRKIDTIYHCGANVHFTRPYESLRQVTVEGTRTILSLACQTSLKPVYYVSTLGVFHSEECLHRESLKESDSLGNGILLPTGYQQAKWVAEGLVTRAKERGVPIVIFRPGIIGPHSRTGVFSSKDLSVMMLKTVFKHNTIPHSRTLDMAPIDWVSRALVTISIQTESIGQTFHLAHPQPLEIEDLRRGSVLAGFNLRLQALDQWLENVSIAAKEEPQHPMASLIPILEVKGAKNLVRILNLAPPVSVENTLKALEGTYTSCPPINRKQLEIWFDRFSQEAVIPSLSKEHRYLWFKERFRGFCSPKSSVSEAEDSFKAGYEQGFILKTPLDIDITASISSIAQVLDERKIKVEGTVYCPLIHQETLKIRTGYWQILAHEAILLQTDSKSHWLRYNLELEDAQGNSFWFVGEKIIRLGWDIWRQTRTLNVSISNTSGLSWVGQTIIPADSYLDDQVRGLQMDETIPHSDQKRAKLVWLFLLWGSGGRSYLQLLLRFGNSILSENINKP